MTGLPPPVRYARARYGQDWFDATLAGVVADGAGDVRLRRLPSAPYTSTGPAGPSGLALDCDCGLYVADTAGDRVLRVDLRCAATVALAGIPAPTGLGFGAHGFLFVASAGRVLVFGTPALSMRDSWAVPGTPIALACHEDSVLVVCSGPAGVYRYDWRGTPDPAFVVAPADLRAVAVGPDATVYVADAATARVLVLDWSGAPAGPPLALGTVATALAVRDGVLYVGSADGVLCYALPDGVLLGPVVGYRGPATALAVGPGALYVKPGLDGSYVEAALDAAYAPSGTVHMGPLDAGLDTGWARGAIDRDLPPETSARLDWYTDDVDPPASLAWQTAPAPDLLLPGGRYLWLRVTLATRDPAVSPTLRQVQARTVGSTYLDQLPLVYRHDPDQPGYTAALLDTFQPTEFPPGDLAYLQASYAHSPPERGFLLRLLELVRAELGDLEHDIDELPTRFDPATAPAGSLRWLASWLACDPPARLGPDELRALLLDLFARHRRRSTPLGVREAVELYAGVRPHVYEEFRGRPLWILGETPLGFGTGLPDRDLEGILVGTSVVGETGPADPATLGAAAFASTAHRFSVIVPPVRGLDDGTRALVTSVVGAERPAHTAFHVCFTEPLMRVGYQARVGVDAIVAAGPPAAGLDGAILGLDARLADGDGIPGQLGIDTRTG